MSTTPTHSDTVIMINHEGMGQAETELQHRLIGSYLRLINENDYLPAAICFYADGVKLTVDGSPVLEILDNLEEKGVRLIICSTCLNFFDLQDKVKTGIVGGMTDIIEAQWRASKVITL
jgi:intracellular sulfur oxidation DsrE/DsrF family protein